MLLVPYFRFHVPKSFSRSSHLYLQCRVMKYLTLVKATVLTLLKKIKKKTKKKIQKKKQNLP